MNKVAFVDVKGEVKSIMHPSHDAMFTEGETVGNETARIFSYDIADTEVLDNWYWRDGWITSKPARPSAYHYWDNYRWNLDAVDLEFIKNKNIFGMTNTAINLNKISKVSFDNKIVAVDWYFFKILLEQGLKSIFTNEMVTYYRQYENNTVGLSVEDNKYYLWWEKR